MTIHSTAIVSSKADIDSTVNIGPNVFIEEDVIIHANVKLLSNAYICKGTEIGEGTVIHPGAVIGNEPQDLSYKGARTFTRIGKNNLIREYATIHRGTSEGSSTIVGDNNLIMVQSHIGHNCEIEDNTIIANGALLAGHMKVEKGVFISGNVVFHQFCRIGEFAMIGGFTGVNKDVPPYLIVRGPSAVRGVNLIGLRRAGISREAISEIKEAYKLVYVVDIPLDEAIKEIKEKYTSGEIKRFVSFIEASKRGICSTRYVEDEKYFDKT